MADEQAQRDQESLAALEAGRIPPTAAARLKENAARRDAGSALFTSNLSVNELLLTRDVGYEPLGQVMGTTVYHVGWQYLPQQTWGYRDPISGLPQSQELGILTEANYKARNLTFNRLMEEASCLRADGVVGVRFERIGQGMEVGMIEFKAVGTAVRKIDRKGAQGRPFLSNLSGQDHWALRKAGMVPVGFVFGNCSWYQVSGWRTQVRDSSGWFGYGNSELPDFTQGVYEAREIAMTRLSQEAAAVGAHGVIGVSIEPHVEIVDVDTGNGVARRDLLAQFTVFGTAVRYEVEAEPHPPVQTTLPLIN